MSTNTLAADDEDILKRPGKLMAKWAEIIATSDMRKRGKTRFISKMEKIRGKIFEQYHEFKDKCEFPPTWKDDGEIDDERFDSKSFKNILGHFLRNMTLFASILAVNFLRKILYVGCISRMNSKKKLNFLKVTGISDNFF